MFETITHLLSIKNSNVDDFHVSIAINPIINFKVTFFEPAIGSRPNFARMCG